MKIAVLGTGCVGLSIDILLAKSHEFYQDEFFHSKVINDLEQFTSLSDVIVTNRITDGINRAKDTDYTRDLFGND